MINLPEGWAIKSEELVSKAHGDLGYELDYSLCYAETTDFTMQIPENIKKFAKVGYVWLNKLTGYRLQKGYDGRWRVIDRPKKQKDRIYTNKAQEQQPDQNTPQEQTPQPQEEEEQAPAPNQQQPQAPEQDNDFTNLRNQIKSNRNLEYYVHNLLRERSDALEWIDRESQREHRSPEEIKDYDKRSQEDFNKQMEMLTKMHGLDPEQFKAYMQKESRLFGPRNRLKTTANQLITELANHKLSEQEPELMPKDESVSIEETKEYYKGLIEKNIRKYCELTGRDPEKEIERVFKKIEDRVEKKVERELQIFDNEKRFQGRFIEESEKRGFEVLYPEGSNRYQDFTLAKDIGGNRLEFMIENLAYRPGIAFMVNDSFDKAEGVDDKTKRAIALATAKAFSILLRTYKDSSKIFTVEAYDGDGNGEYRVKAYKEMGFGDPDHKGRMRGKIVDGKMKPIKPGEKPRVEEDEDEEEFTEKNGNMIDAIYKILFLEDMKGQDND